MSGAGSLVVAVAAAERMLSFRPPPELCAARAPSSHPLLQTVGGCLVILLAIIVQLAVFGALARRQLMPSAFSRKLTHIGAGTAMTTALVLFPLHYWPARLAVSASLVLFMQLFGIVAHLPDSYVRTLSPVLRASVERMVHAMCRTGDRLELMRGTYYYAFVVATFVLLFWTAPINVVVFSSLFIGDGLADPIGRLAQGWRWGGSGDSGGGGAGGDGDGKGGDGKGGGDGGSCGGAEGSEFTKPLLWMQYRVGFFGVKSYPGSLAFFLGSLAAAAFWGSLFATAGHYGPDFRLSDFLATASLCVGAATVAEAISPPHVDNLLVTYAAAAVAFCLSESGAAPYMLQTCA